MEQAELKYEKVGNAHVQVANLALINSLYCRCTNALITFLVRPNVYGGTLY